MSSKIRSQRFKGHFNKVDDWSPIITKRIVWCPIIAIFSLQVGLAKNVEECAEFAPEGGKVVVRVTPRHHSGGSYGVELHVALQALEVSFTEKIQLVLLHHGLTAPVSLTITLTCKQNMQLVMELSWELFVDTEWNISCT